MLWLWHDKLNGSPVILLVAGSCSIWRSLPAAYLSKWQQASGRQVLQHNHLLTNGLHRHGSLFPYSPPLQSTTIAPLSYHHRTTITPPAGKHWIEKGFGADVIFCVFSKNNSFLGTPRWSCDATWSMLSWVLHRELMHNCNGQTLDSQCVT